MNRYRYRNHRGNLTFPKLPPRLCVFMGITFRIWIIMHIKGVERIGRAYFSDEDPQTES